MKKETVFVGVSGGVDSSVAALRLKRQGHTVVGVFIKVWQPDFLTCNWEQERLDAMRVCAHLGIPFLTFDAETTYKKEVADYMIREYQEGRTPNPDIMCNQHVKFGAFLEFARSHGADKIATGHYARVKTEHDRYSLLRGLDTGKDQSYFLWTLTQEQLGYSYFPVGDTPKIKIRKEAEQAGIPIFNKDDSQGICFLGHVDIKDFLGHYTELKPGKVMNEGGEPIGTHEGALIYTLGQRHGFVVHNHNEKSAPHYVVEKNLADNTITVSTSTRKIAGSAIALTHTNYIETSWLGTVEAQFRYRQLPFPVEITGDTGEYAMLNVLSDTIEMPSAGQSCVLYKNDACLGGGIIA